MKIDTLDDLIGKKFKRNKYGLSNWTKTIKHWRLFPVIDLNEGTTVKVEVTGEDIDSFGLIHYWYNLNEIILI